MSRTPRFFTPEQIHKRIKSGRGQGMGKDYQPWLTIQDVPSRGVSHRIYSHKTQRVHHLLSNLELYVFLILDWSSSVQDIAIWFDPATQWYAPSKGKQGRNQTYSDAAIQCCLMIKSLFRLSLRMVTGFVQSLIKLCGLNWIAPDYTTLCRRQKHIDIVISYQKSSDGLHLLMDSTGMKFLGEGEWKRKKHGPEYRRQWRKLHIGIDAKTLQIRAVQLTTNNVSDSQVLGDLLNLI